MRPRSTPSHSVPRLDKRLRGLSGLGRRGPGCRAIGRRRTRHAAQAVRVARIGTRDNGPGAAIPGLDHGLVGLVVRYRDQGEADGHAVRCRRAGHPIEFVAVGAGHRWGPTSTDQVVPFHDSIRPVRPPVPEYPTEVQLVELVQDVSRSVKFADGDGPGSTDQSDVAEATPAGGGCGTIVPAETPPRRGPQRRRRPRNVIVDRTDCARPRTGSAGQAKQLNPWPSLPGSRCPWPRESPRLWPSEVPTGGHESPRLWPREVPTPH